MLDFLKRRLSFLRPVLNRFRRYRTDSNLRRGPGRLSKASRRRQRGRQIQRLKASRSNLIDELSRRDEDYEQIIAELETDRWPLMGSGPLSSSKRQNLAVLRSEVAKFQRYGFGSYTSGISSWAEKWESSHDQRVIMFARQDTAGSLYKWADAVNACTSWAARLVVFEPHSYGYPTDLVFPLPEYADSDLERLLAESTVIHLKDEAGFFDGSLRLPADFLRRHEKPMVFTHFGGSARQRENEPLYQSFVLDFDARIAMTPDLLFPWFNGIYIPHAVDTRNTSNQWRPGRLFCHSPSNPERHGTKAVQTAVGLVQRDLDIDFDLIHGLPFNECLERKRQATLFFDRAGFESSATHGTSTPIGWHGNSAIEAAVHGIPTMSHLASWAIDAATESRGNVMEQLAIINVRPEVESIRERISWFFNLSETDQQELSDRTRQWVEMFHSYEATALELAKVYESIT